MTDIRSREEKIIAARQNTPWREFLKEICSWKNIVLTKNRGMISRYPEERLTRLVSPDQEINILSQEIDRDKDFFTQFKELFYAQDHHSVLMFYGNENADYSDSTFGAKNVYLSFEVWYNASNVVYSMMVYNNAHDVVGSTLVANDASIVFNSHLVERSSKIFYSSMIFDSNNIWWSSNLSWCTECLFCADLNNQSYCIENKQYSKEDYLQRKVFLLKSNFDTGLIQTAKTKKNYDATDKVTDSSQVFLSTWMTASRNILFGCWVWGSSECIDWISVGIDSHQLYGCLATGTHSSNLYFCVEVGSSTSCYYSYYLESCSFCLWCIWLKNKSYCIFNKQYEKDERYAEVERIFAGMESEWTLWKFFPWSINPYYFNDTLAYLADDSFTKEEVEKDWYLWRDEEIKVDIPVWLDVINVDDLSAYESVDTDWTTRIDPEILKKVIIDAQWNYYRVVPMEYKFLKKYGLPLPREHWLERIKKVFDLLWYADK